jgi:hypothetical protein
LEVPETNKNKPVTKVAGFLFKKFRTADTETVVTIAKDESRYNTISIFSVLGNIYRYLLALELY